MKRKETHQQKAQRWFREAEQEVGSGPYQSQCSLCAGPVTCFPFSEGGEMLRAIVICPCCSKPSCPHTTLAVVRGF